MFLRINTIHNTINTLLLLSDYRQATPQATRHLAEPRMSQSAGANGPAWACGIDVMCWYSAALASSSASTSTLRGNFSFEPDHFTMQWSLPFIPYPQAKSGYWSPVTSTLNWCEEVC